MACASVLAGAPRVAKAVQDWREARRQALIARASDAVKAGADAIDWSLLRDPDETPSTKRKDERDDARLRHLALAAEYGNRTPRFQAELARIAQDELGKWSGQGAARSAAARDAIPSTVAVPASSSPGTRTWQNLGPASARFEYNGSYYTANDSGRPTAIAVDDVKGYVYVAVSGGGVWFTPNIASGQPTWTSITDTLPSIAVGAMDVAPSSSLIVLGLGDAFDEKNGSLAYSTNLGTSWSAVVLQGTAGDGIVRVASSVRDVRGDPRAAPGAVWAATDVGLFHVTGLLGSSPVVTLVDLPNPGAPVGTPSTAVEEALWSLAYLGVNASGQSTWAASGVQACDKGLAPPQAGYGLPVGGVAGYGPCTLGNLGDIWTSNDGGATWTSSRVKGSFPATGTAAGNLPADAGRMTLGAGSTQAATSTTLYVQVGSADETSPQQVGILKSTNSGSTWSVAGTTLTNPTNAYPGGPDCGDMNLAHGQSWYNQAVAVDPTNGANALVGGNLCAARTLDGGFSWSNVAHWLPSGGIGTTANGPLPYVHADWHTARSVLTSGTFNNKPLLVTFVGTDGGIFYSANVFSSPAPEQVTWVQPDIGLSTHLTYSVGSGDFASGTPQAVFTGEQDNGTRIRETPYNAAYGLPFDQVIGGDGIGAAVSYDDRGEFPMFFASTEYARFYCNPRKRQCQNATFYDTGVPGSGYLGNGDIPNWQYAPNGAIPAGDGDPFLIRYAALHDPGSPALTASTYNVFKLFIDQNDNFGYTPLTSNQPGGVGQELGGMPIRGLGLHVAPTLYAIAGKQQHVYGVTLAAGRYAVATDDLHGNLVWGGAVSGTTRLRTSTGTLSYTSSITFPHDPAHLSFNGTAGSDITKTFLVSVVAPAYNNGKPIEATNGHVYFTTDGGTNWTPLVGNHTANPAGGTYDLPNVPVEVVRFDPDDATDQTLWAGTDIGVYRSTDGGKTWARYGLGMPAVRISDLFISNNGTLVRAATYGRGIWEIVPGSEARAGARGSGDFDRNGVIDWADVMAAAARETTTPTCPNGGCGSTPSTATFSGLPSYDWSVDLNGDGNIDQTNDMTALLTKFGSTP